MKGISVDSALHTVVREAEKAIHHNQFALVAFLDIEGAFNNVTTATIQNALESLKVKGCITSWIVNMLGTRKITSTIGKNSSTISVSRGTPQGGVLSPLLWLLVVNEILLRFESNHIKVVAYADDVAIIMSGLFAQVACENMNRALKMLKDWAVSCGLNINPLKTELVLFTKKHTPANLTLPKLDGVSISLSSEAKYLGVILDSKLKW